MSTENTETERLLTADEIRSKILEQYELFKPNVAAYHDYAERITALAIEYHAVKLKGISPVLEELVLFASLDARETPKSLDIKLEQILDSGVAIRRVIFDRSKHIYHLFT